MFIDFSQRLVVSLCVFFLCLVGLAETALAHSSPVFCTETGLAAGDASASVGLLYMDDDESSTKPRVGERICSGILLSPTVVLTAAHCVRDHLHARIRFTLDADPTRHPHPSYAQISEIRVHPGYRSGDEYSGDDLAVLRIGFGSYGSEPATYALVAPITSAQLNRAPNFRGFGYGPMDGNERPTKRSRTLHLHGETQNDGNKPSLELKATEGLESCHGDSGGAIFQENAGRPLLVGIMSAVHHVERSNCGRYVMIVPLYLDYVSWVEGNRRLMESYDKCPVARE